MTEENNSTPEKFIRRRENLNNNDKLDSDDTCKLDLGVDLSRNVDRSMNFEDVAAGCNVNETMKKEDNPFSFKHFLYNDIPIYHTQGARPKVYCDGRPISSISDLDLHNSPNMKQTRMVPEFSSALPDFVQDHLVVEQCYLNSEDVSHNFNVNVPNLPDFTPNTRSNITYDSQKEDSICSVMRANEASANNLSMTLNLSTKPLVEFPLDLPIDSHSMESRSCSSSVDVTVSKSLPDFLTDGAVRTQENEVDQLDSSFESEISRLRHENKLYRQQCVEQSRRCEILQRQVDSSRSKEQEYIQSLAKALEQVEHRLEDSNKRTSTADTMITKLRQEIKSFKNEIGKLQHENRILRREQGAVGGPSASTYMDMHSHKVVQELRSSADTAEHSLRQLLIGVDNLRIMASTIENFNRIEENKEIFSDCEDDAGPAL